MTDVVNQQFVDWLASLCNAQVHNTQMIQPLWSGYGACFRATLRFSSKTDSRLNSESGAFCQPTLDQNHKNKLNTQKTSFNEVTKVVVKCATPPNTLSHPRGWYGEASHKRKCQSFKIENHFYSQIQVLTDASCRTARCIGYSQQGEASLLVMEDLAHCGYARTASALTVAQCKTVLKWLAHFHARFLNAKNELDSRGTFLWEEGTYWHLATREDEFHAMPDGALKQNAVAIATTLSDANYQTLVHGDAKVANFCFNEDFSGCAAVDFQYVGYGVGVKDVAYFLGSALSTQAHVAHRGELLNTYFHFLNSALHARLTHCDSPPAFKQDDIDRIIREWRYLYPFACADFYRFLAGWSPEHWKIDEELLFQTEIALSSLVEDAQKSRLPI